MDRRYLESLSINKLSQLKGQLQQLIYSCENTGSSLMSNQHQQDLDFVEKVMEEKVTNTLDKKFEGWLNGIYIGKL